MVTLDGSVCNKIGTSYGAFNTQQQNPCEQNRGACLANSIKDFRESDVDRESITIGSGLYLIKNQKLEYLLQNNRNRLQYKVEEIQTTLIRLELKADSIQYVRTVANGQISFMDARQEEGVDVKLIVILENVDDIVSRFNFKIEDCDNGPVITPAKEVELSIDPLIPQQ